MLRLKTASCCKPFHSASNTITDTLAVTGCEEVPFSRKTKVFMVMHQIREIFIVFVLSYSTITEVKYTFYLRQVDINVMQYGILKCIDNDLSLIHI